MLGVSQCDLHTATSNQHSSRSPEVAAGSVAGIHPNQRHPRGAVDRISPSRELKGRVRETYDVDFTEAPPSRELGMWRVGIESFRSSSDTSAILWQRRVYLLSRGCVSASAYYCYSLYFLP